MGGGRVYYGDSRHVVHAYGIHRYKISTQMGYSGGSCDVGSDNSVIMK